MLERLKKLFSPHPQAAEAEYERPSRDTAAVIPVGPPTGPYTPAAPVEDPAPDEPEPKP